MTTKKFELRIDDGSGDCKAVLFDEKNNIVWKMPLGVFDLALHRFGEELFR